MNERIAVIGLGYVGLPVALALGQKYPNTVGMDINTAKINSLRAGVDHTHAVTSQELQLSSISFTHDPKDIKGSTFYVVAVPTPIDEHRRPDLTALLSATRLVGDVIEPGAIVVYESTVYPGLTEEICGPLLEQISGLKRGIDFKLGYSPERINPGDNEHTLQSIVKVVSGEDEESLGRIAEVYSSIIPAGIHCAPSIKVAEAAKVIENTQRDLNIALMNELAIIFDRLDISTRDVLAAARTKWNFLPFTPGLVGGHCIGVDPFYLTTKAESVGYYPQVILAGRRINDGMGAFVAQKLIKLLVHKDIAIKKAKVGVLGLTFKENVPDLRNSRVPDILAELNQFGIMPLVDDPMADPEEAFHEYAITLDKAANWKNLDALILAVPHKVYLQKPIVDLLSCLNVDGILVDVKGAFSRANLSDQLTYWAL